MNTNDDVRLDSTNGMSEETEKQPWYVCVLTLVFAWKPKSERGSQVRRVMSRIVVYLVIAFIVEVLISKTSGTMETNWNVAALGSVLSVGFFSYAVVIVSLLTTATFHIDARRLFKNTLLSAVFMVLTFAHIYRLYGLHGMEPESVLDFVYFSAVTFSTLGFGDFSPVGTVGRLCAALQAMLGNLHLAMLVGAVFLRMSRRQPPKIT